MQVDVIRLTARAVLLAAVAASAAGCTGSGSSDEPFDQAADDEAADEGPQPLGDPAKGDVLMLGGGLGGAFKFGDKSGVVEVAKTGSVEFYDAGKRKFASAGKLKTNRFGATGGPIVGGSLDGQALVAGGFEGEANIKKSVFSLDAKALATGEAYDPDKAKSKALADKLGTARAFHTETTLPDGRVVIAGGLGADLEPLNTVEIFYPDTKTFQSGGVIVSPRAFHTATLLPNGLVLFTGGVFASSGGVTPTAETYNPATATSQLTATRMKDPSGADVRLAGQAATLISGCGCAADGKVLLTGGFNSFSFGGPALTSSTTIAMLYDPATRAFTAAGVPQLNEERVFQSATPLAGGKVLIAGGLFGQVQIDDFKIDGLFGGLTGTAEIYDPAAGKMTCVGGASGEGCKRSLVNARFGHAAVRLSNGQVLLAGGAGGKNVKKTKKGFGAPLKTAETFDPDTSKFKAVGSMKAARLFPATAVVE